MKLITLLIFIKALILLIFPIAAISIIKENEKKQAAEWKHWEESVYSRVNRDSQSGAPASFKDSSLEYAMMQLSLISKKEKANRKFFQGLCVGAGFLLLLDGVFILIRETRLKNRKPNSRNTNYPAPTL
ncbi:hypothetical protein M2447_002575 [Ereboglobus sp. PH5-10]|uniref:hypothetical protein n=1 Tax=Ereboglobus sp. PH5-10 TaxID=2940629 RepID=UPI0024052A06|nr:hypothetical protein [Ereboglobus sp. PH5-10]MDF9828456.1 hypothetical protein [Ereboglobus sp. PH5-10]